MNTIKCVLVGDEAVGKTSLLSSYCRNRFPTDYVPTIFDAYAVKVTVCGKVYTLRLDDTTGQEAYDMLRPLSYHQTDVFLVCFSVVSPVSLKNAVEMWVPEVRSYCPRALILLVGTETDLRNKTDTVQALAETGEKPVTREQGKKTAKKLQVAKYVECSALTQKGLKDVFDETILTCLSPLKYKLRTIRRWLRW